MGWMSMFNKYNKPDANKRRSQDIKEAKEAVVPSNGLTSARSSLSIDPRRKSVDAQNGEDLDTLVELILRIGSLIHQLQKERGVSAMCVGKQSQSSRTGVAAEQSMHQTLTMLQLQTDKSFDELQQVLCDASPFAW
eukprot:1175801-Prorocentrum_minimum.AAC.2